MPDSWKQFEEVLKCLPRKQGLRRLQQVQQQVLWGRKQKKGIQIEEDNQGDEPQSQQAGEDCPSDESTSPSK
jgi:hypothetical protein